MAKKIIFIDPGHGGKDSGATNGNRHEADDNLRLSLLIKAELEKQDVEVVLSRTTDTYIDVDSRPTAANNIGADYFLSVHRNDASASATGNEIWVLRAAQQATWDKADKILDAVCAVDALANRGTKRGAPSYNDFGVNRISKMPSALIEMGFISNVKDNTRYDAFIEDYAKAIAKALCENVGVTYKPDEERYSVRLIWDDDSTEIGVYSTAEEAIANCPVNYSVINANGENIFVRWPGDIDGDGNSDVSDAREILRAAIGITVLSDVEKTAADMDGDGKISTADARKALRKAVNIE